MKKDEFKEFVRKNPKLISFVKSDQMTWQKFYEMYDLYGDKSDVWKEYINTDQKKAEAAVTGFSASQIVNWLKNIDLDSVQEGIGNVQRVLGVFEDLTKNGKSDVKESYKPRPLYKHFED